MSMKETGRDVRDLVGGPQDGGRVCRTGYPLPHRLYVGRKWMGDGYATWATHPGERFPCEYEKDDSGKMRFTGYIP